VILIDTNVFSELMCPEPDPAVVAWLDAQPEATLWTTTINAFEMRFGVARMPHGRRRDALEQAIHDLLRIDFAQRVLDFDASAARHAASFAAEMEAKGRTVDVRDLFLAGIAASRGAKIATPDSNRFPSSVQVISPWDHEFR